MTMPLDSPGPYAQGLLHRLGDRDPIEVLEGLGPAVRELFDGLPDDVIRRPERPGKWSMLEVLHHLADSDMVVGFRVRMMLAHDQPPITAYDQDLWADKLRYRDARLSDVLDQLEAMRAANLRIAKRLTAEDQARFGVHSERGGESVGYTIRLQAGHDLVHRDQIARIRKEVYNSGPARE